MRAYAGEGEKACLPTNIILTITYQLSLINSMGNIPAFTSHPHHFDSPFYASSLKRHSRFEVIASKSNRIIVISWMKFEFSLYNGQNHFSSWTLTLYGKRVHLYRYIDISYPYIISKLKSKLYLRRINLCHSLKGIKSKICQNLIL